MTDQEKQIQKQLMDEFAAALAAQDTVTYDLRGAGAFAESVEQSALRAAVAAYYSWVVVRALSLAIRAGEST